MRRVNSEIDWKVTDPLIAPGHPVSLVLYLLHDGEEVHELLSLAVKEFSILWIYPSCGKELDEELILIDFEQDLDLIVV